MNLDKGKRYWITHKKGRERIPRAFVGVYLGVNRFDKNRLEFSLRPEAGTTFVLSHTVLDAKITDEPCGIKKRSPLHDKS